MKNLMFRLSLLLLVFSSCRKSDVKLNYTNAENEVPVLGNLIFNFSAPLATDSMLNKWDSTEFITFSPEIRGRFRWEAKDQLVFSPAGPLLPATSYKATLSSGLLLANSTYKKLEQGKAIEFRSPDLSVEQQYFSWTKAEGSTQTIPQIELLFNYPVAIDMLKEKLQVDVDGKMFPVSFITNGSSASVKARVLDVKTEDRDYQFKVSIRQGLKPEGGQNGLIADKTYESVLTSPYLLVIQEVTAEHDGDRGSIFIRTNQGISDNEFSQLITIDPQVKFSVEKNDQGLLVTGDNFSVDNSYMITLKKGLKGKLGGVLKEDISNPVTFGELEPSLAFANQKSVYLSAAGEKNIELKITNIAEIKLVVSKVYENNLITADRYGYYPKESYSDDEGYYDEYSEGSFGDVLYEQTIDTKTLPGYGKSKLLRFNPMDKIPSFKGIYHIQVRSTKDYWERTSRFISLSDIGLIAKTGSGKMLVFANSLQTANSLSGVGIQVYGLNNQLIGSGQTDGEGLAAITLENGNLIDGFKPAMVVARLGDDFNYLPFNNTAVNTSRYSVGGKKINSTGMDAYVLPERDMYRPGETMHFGIILRDANRNNPGAIPVKIKMLMPNGKELIQLRKTLDDEGLTEAAVPLTNAALTGSYTMELYSGNDVLITTHTFKVEEFVPDRIKVTTKLDKELVTPGENTSLMIDAVNYFGPPAAGRNYETEIQIKEKTFNPADFSRYDFTLNNRLPYLEKIVKQGKTDASGHAEEAFTVPAAYKGLGLLQARFFATVFDENGRPVSRNVSIPILTQQTLLGIGSSGYNYFSLNQPASFPLIALNYQEKIVSAKAKITVIKRQYRTVLSKSGDYFRYNSQPDDKVMQEQFVQIQGANTRFSYIPRESGEYEIRVAIPGIDNYLSRKFYSYGSWGSNTGDFEVNTDGQVDIATDKKEYKKGDKLKALFKAPFDGRLLVTFESSEVLLHKWVEVKNRTASVDFSLDDGQVPNAYITATLFKPHTTSNIPLTAAHGFANVTVKDPSKKMDVAIKAAATSRSERKQKITVKADAGAMVNLAVVDNGILAVSGFRTPDPFAWYFEKRALNVQSWDLYPLLFPELRRTMSTGGDGDLSMDLRQNPIKNKRFKLLSYWSGWRKADRSGEVTFDVDIPAFSGQVRLMAVGVSSDHFGASEAAMQVADPLVLSTSMPRFISPGDTVMAGVTLSNTTGKTANVQATVKVKGSIALREKAAMQTSIQPNAEGRIEFPVYATNTPGIATLLVEAKALGETFKEEIEIAVRPSSTLQRRTGSGVVSAGSNPSFQLSVSDFMPETIHKELMVGRSPLLQLGTPLRYLVNYPYGCTEQTISNAFPQLYYADMSLLMKEGGSFNKAANQNVQTAIQKLKMRQLYNGGMMMWDNMSQENWWVTAYAAHFLLEARKAGFAPDPSLLETMLQYLTNKLRNRELINYYYNVNQQKRIAPKEVTYSLYVLSLAGRPNISAMNYYKANNASLSLDSKYVLAATYALAGDRKSFAAILPSSFAGEESLATGNGSFYSDIRDEGLALNVLLEADPKNAQIPVMATHLINKINKRTYFSTQEASFSILALGKMARLANESKASAEVLVDGKKVASVSGNLVKLNQNQLAGSTVSIKSSGAGNLYYWWQASGVSATGQFKEEDNYLKVRRQLYTRTGALVSGNTFKQNELIVVKITLEKSFNGSIDNVVVTDLLPGGWEIENDRIKDIPGMDWIKDESTPLSRDVRDDRIHFFTDLNNSKQVFYYSVRAVTPGYYRQGPLSADAMYQGEYHSYSGAGMIRVTR